MSQTLGLTEPCGSLDVQSSWAVVLSFPLPMLHNACTYTRPCSPASVVQPPQILSKSSKNHREKEGRWEPKQSASMLWLNHVNVFWFVFFFFCSITMRFSMGILQLLLWFLLFFSFIIFSCWLLLRRGAPTPEGETRRGGGWRSSRQRLICVPFVSHHRRWLDFCVCAAVRTVSTEGAWRGQSRAASGVKWGRGLEIVQVAD